MTASIISGSMQRLVSLDVQHDFAGSCAATSASDRCPVRCDADVSTAMPPNARTAVTTRSSSVATTPHRHRVPTRTAIDVLDHRPAGDVGSGLPGRRVAS
jgi:hypothetical protein